MTLKPTRAGTIGAKFFLTVPGNTSQSDDFPCVAWDKIAEFLSDSCSIGDLIGIDGTLEHRRWKTTDGSTRSIIRISAQRVEILAQHLTPTRDAGETVLDEDGYHLLDESELEF